jgi:hypothetical protein
MPFDDDLDANILVTTRPDLTSRVVIGQGPPGPQGAIGPAGPAGVNSGHAVRNFATPSTTWEFDHGLGYPPAVMTYDASGRQIGGQVTENTAARTVVEFAIPVTGSLSLS